MQKQFLTNTQARQKLEQGVNKVADLVKIKLGPKGRNVVLDRKFATPLITNDGVTIAKEINLPDPFENMGASLIKEVCIKTNDIAGDGTTTAIVLSQCMLNEGLKNFVAGCNPIKLNIGLKKATELCIETLQKNSIKIDTNKQIEQIATVSSADPKIGMLIAKAKALVGEDGVITLQDSKTDTTDLSVVEGIQFENGYISPYLCTNQQKMQIEYDEALVLLTDQKISSIQQILPILEQLVGTTQKLIIIADDFDEEVVSTIIVNKMRNMLNCALIKAPLYGEKRRDFLQDMAILCNTKVYSNTTGDNLSDLTIEDLGNAKNIVITKHNTTLLCKCLNKQELDSRISLIKQSIQSAPSDYDKEQLKIRLARLTGGIGVISVGATTDVELQEKKLRIEDALSATNSACQQGITLGGGCALLKCNKPLQELINSLDGDEKVGAQILQKVICAPLLQIAKNAGVSGEVILQNINNSDNPNYGYNALDGSYCDMIEQGIIDPTLVTITALNNACSVVSTMLTTEALVTDLEDKAKSLQ